MTADYLNALEDELRRVTSSADPLYGEFFNVFHYHLGWTDMEGAPARFDRGKRIRPLLCLYACAAAGGNWRAALPAAAAVELVHNFSLIHDDIEDNSQARRGRPTVWQVWGLAQGVNAGDALFVLAHLALDGIGANLPAERVVAIQRVLDRAAFKLTQGQYLDLGYERADQVTLAQYLQMVEGKTAALVSAACEMGARIATTEQPIIAGLADYGRELGIGFQISDDVLGLWGDPNVTGKSARTDLLSRKKSYPVLLAMQSRAGAELRGLYAKPEWSQADVERVEQILDEGNAREQALTTAQAFAQRALAALASTGLENQPAQLLRERVTQMVYREK